MELNKRWLGWPTRPDTYFLCARLSSGGKIARVIYHLIFCLQQVSRPAAASGRMRGHHELFITDKAVKFERYPALKSPKLEKNEPQLAH